MIDTVRVEGFKSIPELDLELGLVNVFIGANGAGKSNLMEALGVLGAASFGSVEPETLRYRGVRLGLPALYKSSFQHASRIRRLITLEATASGATYRLGLDNPIDRPEPKWRVTSESLTEAPGRPLLTRSPRNFRLHGAAGAKQRPPRDDRRTLARMAVTMTEGASKAARLLDELEGFAIFSPTTAVLRGLSPDEVDRAPLGLRGKGLPEALRDVLRASESECLGPFPIEDVFDLIEWADDLSVVPTAQTSQSPEVKSGRYSIRFRDRYMRSGRDHLTAYDASEGALFVLYLLTLVSHSQAPRMLAVDNFDHALHPRLVARLVRQVAHQVATVGGPQILLTSHNPLVLDGLDLLDDRIRLFAVERSEPEGYTRVRRIQVTRELLDLSGSGLSLSQLWVMGRLGAAPRWM